MLNAVRRFFGWWIEELARTVEPLASRRAGAPSFVLLQRGESYTCLRGGRRGMKELGTVSFRDAPESDVLRKLKNQNFELRLDPDTVLDKELRLPAAGQQYLDAILRHQIERLTPWAADHVSFDYEIKDSTPSADGQVGIRLVATSRETVEKAVAPLTALGIRPSLIGTAGDPVDHQSPVDLQVESKTERQSSLRRVVATSLAAAAVVLLLVGGLQTWRLYQVSSQSANVQAQVDRYRERIAEAVARTTASDEYRALAARKEAAMPMVALLEELSKTIPDDTYLTELNVEGDTLRVNGMSSAATALIELLEKADALADARFAAPTTRSEKGNADSFQIVVRVGEPQPGTQ